MGLLPAVPGARAPTSDLAEAAPTLRCLAMGAGDPRRELPRLAAPIFYAARRARDLRLHLRERGASLEIGPAPRPSVKPRLAPGVVGTSPEAAAVSPRVVQACVGDGGLAKSS